jgi:hypothetical protein
MTEFSLEPVPAPARRPRFYASPFDDQYEFFTYVYYKALHAGSKGKPLPQILFRDGMQSAAFHQVVTRRLKQHRRRKDQSDRTIESDVLKHLSRESIPSSAATNLEGVENAVVDIFGHGMPGLDRLTNATGRVFATMTWIENLLDGFGLSSIGEIRLSTCYGAAGQFYKGSAQEWEKHFKEDNLPALYDPKNSLGAKLHDDLRKKYRYAGTVRASLTALSLWPRVFHPKGGEQERHYAGVPQIRHSDGRYEEIGKVRKRYVMFTFGEGMQGSAG